MRLHHGGFNLHLHDAGLESVRIQKLAPSAPHRRKGEGGC